MPAMRESVQPLGAHMVRRLPTKAELAERTSLVLTERDKEILSAVHTQGFLTTDLIELAFFPPPAGGRRTHSSRAYDRLRQLWLWSYLERVELPVSRTLGGRQPFLYTLGRRGVPVVTAHLGPDAGPVHCRRLDRLDNVFVEHDLIVATLWANLKALIRSTQVPGLRWTPERELRACHARVKDPEKGRWIPFLPDAHIEIDNPDDTVQCYLVEVDMGTLTLARFRRKLRAFETYLAQGLFERNWDRSVFDVMVLTNSRSRLQHLWQAARSEVPEERWDWYLFATFEILQPRKFGGQAYLTLGGEQTGLLDDDAFEEKRGDDAGVSLPIRVGRAAGV